MTTNLDPPQAAAAHLTPEHWERANRLLVRKALAEFAHERLISPEPQPAGHYVVRGDDQLVEYRFIARLLTLEHWEIDADSISKHRDGSELPLDALDLMLEIRGALSLDENVLPSYLEEISSTLAGTAFKLASGPASAVELAQADFQSIETGMTEGHPCFVANNGRVGFDSREYRFYAPEAASPVRLIWLAVHPDVATFSAASDVDYSSLVRNELDVATVERFSGVLRESGLDLDDFYLVPAHPWQWWNKLSITFAADIARRRIVCLGYGDDEYLAQQSIRTFFNRSAPGRHYVKTALSVLNMGFMRGLSAEYMKETPAINEWLGDLVAEDAVLSQTRFDILRERAAVGYHPEHYEAGAAKGSPYLKMLAALWRESPVPKLEPGQRLATMASLLHTDTNGGSVVGELIAESGLEPATWLRRYLDAYLLPILHCFYAYDLVCMPHGENIILVVEQGVPVRVLLKDIGEEIAVIDQNVELPAAVERIRQEVPDHLKTLSIFTDVFDCFFRLLNGILDSAGILDEDAFWSTVAGCITDYQKSLPQLASKFAEHDLFAERFEHSCLNRLQLRDNKQMVNLQDPAGGLQFAGMLDNPLAPHRVS
ncbi:IucA/IucC family protein [Parasphingorhabdus pacifica]